MFDAMNAIARKKIGANNDWNWCQCEAVDGGFILNGSTSHIGKDGKMKWDKPYKKVIISDSEIDAANKEYEENTGNCYKCEGSGIEQYGWNRDIGQLTRACKRCGGNNFGKPQNKSVLEKPHIKEVKQNDLF